MKLADTPAASTRYTGLNAAYRDSSAFWPIAYTITDNNISDDTTSITADSRSTASVIPSGTGHPPACITIMSRSSTRTNRMIATIMLLVSADRLTTRWTQRTGAAITHSAAPSSGTMIGRGISAFTADPPRPLGHARRVPLPRRPDRGHDDGR